MARLIIYEELEDEETIFETFGLTVNRILVGSDPDNHLVLDAPDIDPTHASLEFRDETWILQDLGGPGGTAVNGQMIDGPYQLDDSDLIELGHIKIKFHLFDEDDGEEEAVIAVGAEGDEAAAPMSGRVWFATVASITGLIIFVIVLLLLAADFLDLIKIADLLPPWLPG